jgi:hypothetical protein
VWTTREKLHKQLVEHKVPEAHDATAEVYIQLLEKSEPWWKLLRMFKVRQFHSGFKLAIPKTFGPVMEEGVGTTEEPLEVRA